MYFLLGFFKGTLFLLIFVHMCNWVYVYHVCMGGHGDQKAARDSLQLEWQVVVGYNMGAGNWIPVLCKSK